MEAIITHRVSKKVVGNEYAVEGSVYDIPPAKTSNIAAHTIYKLYKDGQHVTTLVNPNKLSQDALISECNRILSQPKAFEQ